MRLNHIRLLFAFLLVFCHLHNVQSKQYNNNNNGNTQQQTNTDGSSPTLVKTLRDFDFLDDKPLQGFWIVKFYAPWCGHCKQFKPVFEEGARLTTNDASFFKFGEIDCDAYPQVCTKYNIKAYPTTLLLLDGNFIEKYDKRRKSNEIKTWVLNKADQYYRSLPLNEQIELKIKLEIMYEHDLKIEGRTINQVRDKLSDYYLSSNNNNRNNIENNRNNNNNRNNRNNNDRIDRNRRNNKNNRNNRYSGSDGSSYGGISDYFGEFRSVSKVYEYFLGDTHPTVPLIIYILGTVFGIFVGVAMVLCCTT